MRRLDAVPLVLSLLLPAAAGAQQEMDRPGVKSMPRLEEVVSGHLEQLNGKYKLRATEVTYAPGASVPAHHHAGPGIRYIAAGEITFVQGGKETVYKTGQYFFESGDIVHTAHNAGKTPTRMIFFEILPVSWSGGSSMPPKAH